MASRGIKYQNAYSNVPKYKSTVFEYTLAWDWSSTSFVWNTHSGAKFTIVNHSFFEANKHIPHNFTITTQLYNLLVFSYLFWTFIELGVAENFSDKNN